MHPLAPTVSTRNYGLDHIGIGWQMNAKPAKPRSPMTCRQFAEELAWMTRELSTAIHHTLTGSIAMRCPMSKTVINRFVAQARARLDRIEKWEEDTSC
jgi:hypothetical protein